VVNLNIPLVFILTLGNLGKKLDYGFEKIGSGRSDNRT
jgi:hypothetical protein